MKKLITLSSILAIILSQAGCVGGGDEQPKQEQLKQEQEVAFPYATKEIKQELAKKIFGQNAPIPDDFFETVNYVPMMQVMAQVGPSVFGEKEEQQVFWYYVMRLRMLTMYYTYPRAIDDWGILVEQLNMLSGPARKFIEEHPQEGQAIFASVIDYEEKHPYNPQKGIDEQKNKIKNMTREDAMKTYGISSEELSKLSDEQFKEKLEEVIDGIDDVPTEFSSVRQKILQAFKNDLEQMKSGLSPEEYAAEKKAEVGITDYTVYVQAPEMFPAEIFFAEFILDPNDDDKRYVFQKLFLRNGNISGDIHIGDDKPLPHKIDLIWYSIIENKTYSLEEDLPYEIIKEKLMPEERKFNSLLVTLAPYGQVSLYLYNSINEKKELLAKFESEETEVSLGDFRQSGALYESLQEPAKDWKDYQKHAFNQFPRAATFFIHEGLPGKDFNFWNDVQFRNYEDDYPVPEKEKLNELNENGETPLIDAVRSNKKVLVTKLLNIGVDVNIVSTRTGETALSAAASMNIIGNVKQLIEAGADVNQMEGKSGMSPLMLAARSGNTEIVKLLVEAGADVNAKQFMYGQDIGYNALKYAREAGKEEIVNFLISRGAQEPLVQQGPAVAPLINSLDQALMAGNVEKVKEFLAKGANPNTLIPGVGPALLFACTLGNAEIIQALVDAKADVNSVSTATGFTPLMMACQLGNKPIVEILIKAKADVNVQHQMNGQPSGLNALKIAQNGGFNEIADLLKQAGAKE